MNEQNMTGYPSIDKPWLKYYSETFDSHDIPNMSIYQLAIKYNQNRMDSVAFDIRSSANGYQKGVKITYRTFFEQVQRTAKALTALGVTPNEIIPLLLPNIPEARVLIYANSAIGAVSYPISPLLPVNQLKDLISKNGIKTVFVFEMFLEKYQSALAENGIEHIVVLTGSESLPMPIQLLLKMKSAHRKMKRAKIPEKYMCWRQFIAKARKIDALTPYYKENHVTAIIGTSGTTGRPKGVCLTDRNINTVAVAYIKGNMLEGESMMDALLPSIGYGISMLHYQTCAGKYVYLIPELLTTSFAEVLCKLRPDNFAGGPIHYINLRNSEEFKSGKLPIFKNLISGGASLPKDVENALNRVSEGYEECGVNEQLVVRQGYGLSENVAMGTYSRRGAYKFGSIGIPVPYVVVSIFETDTEKEVKYNVTGEICITGPSVMQGYLNDTQETNKVILTHSDGRRWIHTKDIGYMDEKGHVFLIDRAKNIFMRMGFNVHPATVAEFINSFSFIKNCVVIGFEHPAEQCVPVAFLEIGSSNIPCNTIIRTLEEGCRSSLEEMSVPYAFVIVDELPINAGGKIDIQRIKQTSGINFQLSDDIPEKLIFR